MVIPKEFLDLLLCPEDGSPLRVADDALVSRLNEAIAARKLFNRAGSAVEKPLDGGLVRADGLLLYPIRDGIPVMLSDEAIPIEPAPARNGSA